MTHIQIKRVYDAEELADGFRVLIDKLWPRGISKERLHYDLWAKDIAPSTPLRTWFHEDESGRWAEFTQRYRDELETNPATASVVNRLREYRTVTLLYASKNAINNHAVILKEYLEDRLNATP